MNKELGELIANQDAARRELLLLQGKNPADTSKYQLYAPADDAAITAAERGGPKYSPLYQEFLRLHNGWLGFWPGWSLVGVPRADNTAMYADIKTNLDLLPDVVGVDDMERLTDRERSDPAVFRLDKHPLIGLDFNGSFLALDENRVDSAGEPQVVWVHYLQHVERRWPTFLDLLRDALTQTTRRVEQLRSKP